MENIDLNRLKTAITYAERIAEGKNPVTNGPSREDDIINDPNVIRCMFFIRDILQQVYDNGGRIGSKAPKAQKPDRKPFPAEVLAAFAYRQDQGISNLIRQINEPVDQNTYEPLERTLVSVWLEQEGYLCRPTGPDGRRVTRPTDKGIAAGIYLADRNYDGRSYTAVMYGKQIQELIVSKIPEMLKKKAGLLSNNNTAIDNASASNKAATAGTGPQSSSSSGTASDSSDPYIDYLDRAYRNLASTILKD